jgi:hypothetical protein
MGIESPTGKPLLNLVDQLKHQNAQRLASGKKLPDESHSLYEVRTVLHRRPASTMSLQERIAELHEIRERHAGDPLITDACDAAIKALRGGIEVAETTS